jgi:hypothetical protein
LEASFPNSSRWVALTESFPTATRHMTRALRRIANGAPIFTPTVPREFVIRFRELAETRQANPSSGAPGIVGGRLALVIRDSGKHRTCARLPSRTARAEIGRTKDTRNSVAQTRPRTLLRVKPEWRRKEQRRRCPSAVARVPLCTDWPLGDHIHHGTPPAIYPKT